MKKEVMVLFAVLWLMVFRLAAPVFAETITLKTGLRFEGRVIEKTDRYIIVDWQGQEIRYSLSEIERIEQSPTSAPSIAQQTTTSEPQQVWEYVNKSGLIMESVKEKILAKQAQLAQASTTQDREKILAITTEIRDTFAEHKQQFLALSVPADCQALHSVALQWYQLQVDIYNELLNGNIQKSQLLTQELIECFDKMQQESDRLTQRYQ